MRKKLIHVNIILNKINFKGWDLKFKAMTDCSLNTGSEEF